ncbi:MULTISPECIES: hypothetical protein [unclassified Caballeronia]|uniref:hypothetical protein n=1 Tax=unclassified Caballeronia TaxID=2646786 RepID=UPI00285CF875|nr:MULTISPECIES: hypothetical protein [unclassified Caballeronia]MDR5739181.1 hypothetical protein [Caballeronia sp. LZ016]MDR5807669.1 hypothetical protein [Caballeronia sp. LZ019]
MQSHYTDTARALRDTLRLSVERGGASSLAQLHQHVVSETTLLGEDACAQAARIRRQLERLSPIYQALLTVRYAPRESVCCRRRCCAGHYPNPEWARALALVVAHTAQLFSGCTPNLKLRQALVANLLTHTHEAAVDVAQRCGVHRATVASHTAILSTALLGTRTSGGAFDQAFARIDERLHEAGIVVSAAEAQDTESPQETA